VGMMLVMCSLGFDTTVVPQRVYIVGLIV